VETTAKNEKRTKRTLLKNHLHFGVLAALINQVPTRAGAKLQKRLIYFGWRSWFAFACWSCYQFNCFIHANKIIE